MQGAENIIAPKRLGFGVATDAKADHEFMKGRVMEEVKRLFKPEFLNRIDEIIVFHPLNEDNMKKIVGLMCKEVVQRAKEQLEIILVVRDSVKKHIVETGSDKKYGARPLRRAVQSQLEDKLAEALLNGEIKRGDHVEAGISKKEIKFYSQRDKQLAKEEVLLYNKKNGSDVENSQSTSRKRKTIRRI
mgnify:CR=1 FL=1